MYAQEKKAKENKIRPVANSIGQKKTNVNQGFGFVDKRPEAFVGQNYLNTGLSSSYKGDKSKIAGGKPKIFWGEEHASIVDGHHRTIWSFYHGDDIDFQMAGFGSQSNFGEMKYADAPEPIKVTEDKKEEG